MSLLLTKQTRLPRNVGDPQSPKRIKKLNNVELRRANDIIERTYLSRISDFLYTDILRHKFSL